MRGTILAFVLAAVLSPALAQDVVIDSFDYLNQSYLGVYIEPSLSLTPLSTSGNALNMTLGPYDEGYLVRNNLTMDLPNPLNYYNLSFWYYKVSDDPDCNGDDYTNFGMNAYLSELEAASPDGDWIVLIFTVDGFESRDGIKSCNVWHRFNRALDDYDGGDENVNLSNTHLGSFAIEIFGNPDMTVLFDELRLMPKLETCAENWQCSSWSACAPTGTQTRTCTDLNTCGTTYDKPFESQTCTYSAVSGCTPDWDCYEWGDCVDGIQGRVCYDRNSCETLTGQPQIGRQCVTPKLDINAHVADAFERTDTIIISGNVTDEFGAPKPADVIISLSSGLFSRMYHQYNVSKFSLNYTITQTDPVGIWGIRINATDGSDVGLWEREIPVFKAIAYETYNILFTSPDEGTPYARGEDVGITVRVEQGGSAVSGADVFMYISNQKITLGETTPGSYHVGYTIPYHAGLGALSISVRAEKGETGGTKTVNVYVLPAMLNVVLTSEASVGVGTSTTISANVTYPDGIPASGLELSVAAPDGALTLVETAPGVYTATYTPSSLGVFDIQLDVQDAYANVGTMSASMTITQPGLFELLAQHWYFVVIAIVIVALVGYPLSKRRLKSGRRSKLVEEGRRIMKMQKELQESYFKAGEIDMDTFKKKSAEYEKRLTRIREEMEGIKPPEK